LEEAKEEGEAPGGEETTAEEEVEEDPPIKLYKSTRLKGTYCTTWVLCCLGVKRMRLVGNERKEDGSNGDTESTNTTAPVKPL
jgi:hypothetical protein